MSQHNRTASEPSTSNVARVGLYAALATALVTLVTFALAMIAIPISGANCPGECATYPYLDTVSQYPRDFLWMLFAMFVVVGYVTLMVSIHSYVDGQKKILAQVGLSFALIAAGVLLIDYYLQFFVVPMSLMNTETQGLALLIQYNPHGIFLALEELGYLVMALSFLFVGLALPNTGRLETAVRWIFVAGFGLVALSLVAISLGYGLEKLDRFEVLALSIDWLVLIVNGILLSILFRRRLKTAAAQGIQ
jgi:hypothetical protein